MKKLLCFLGFHKWFTLIDDPKHKHFPTRDLEWKDSRVEKPPTNQFWYWKGDDGIAYSWLNPEKIKPVGFKWCLEKDYEQAASYESLNNCLGEGWEKIDVEGYEERWKHELGLTLDYDGDYFYISKKGLLAQWHDSICKPEHINSIIKL